MRHAQFQPSNGNSLIFFSDSNVNAPCRIIAKLIRMNWNINVTNAKKLFAKKSAYADIWNIIVVQWWNRSFVIFVEKDFDSMLILWLVFLCLSNFPYFKIIAQFVFFAGTSADTYRRKTIFLRTLRFEFSYNVEFLQPFEKRARLVNNLLNWPKANSTQFINFDSISFRHFSISQKTWGTSSRHRFVVIRLWYEIMLI